MNELLSATTRRALRYLESLNDRPVGPTPQAMQRLALFDVPLQEESLDPRLVIEELDEIGSPGTMAMAGPRFFGFVIGGSLPVTVAAQWLATAWDQNTGLYRVTPGAA